MESYSTQSSQEECPDTMGAETATTTADYTVCHRVIQLASQVHLTDDAKMFRCVAVEPLMMCTLYSVVHLHNSQLRGMKISLKLTGFLNYQEPSYCVYRIALIFRGSNFFANCCFEGIR